jgi:Fic family protein
MQVFKAGHLVKRSWNADMGAYGGRKARQAFSYEAFVPETIADQDFVLRADVAAAVSEAESAVQHLNSYPPAFGSFEALARSLLRAEAIASSRIEGLELSHRRLAKAAYDSTKALDVTAESVLGNMHAMEAAVKLGAGTKRMTSKDIVALHHILMSATRDTHIAGVVRTQQNWIGRSSGNPRDAEFIPPPPEFVLPLLDDLAEFLNREDLSPVVQAAIAHAQFETIHPFADGNGRIGRCLIHVAFRRRALAPRYVPPVSLVLATDARAYIAGLTDYRSARLDDWTGVFAAATRTAAVQAQSFADRVARLQERWREEAAHPRASSAADKLIALLPAYPIVGLSLTRQLLRVSDPAAWGALQRLERAGVLRQITVGRRNRAYEAVGLFDVVNRFERELATSAGKTKPTRPVPRKAANETRAFAARVSRGSPGRMR